VVRALTALNMLSDVNGNKPTPWPNCGGVGESTNSLKMAPAAENDLRGAFRADELLG
jgi:hypothetical protein